MVEYRTAPQANSLIDGDPPAGSSWWVRRHTARGPQLAHAIPHTLLTRRSIGPLDGGRIRWHAQCSTWLRSPDYETFEIAPGPNRLPTDWRACQTCRDRTLGDR